MSQYSLLYLLSSIAAVRPEFSSFSPSANPSPFPSFHCLFLAFPFPPLLSPILVRLPLPPPPSFLSLSCLSFPFSAPSVVFILLHVLTFLTNLSFFFSSSYLIPFQSVLTKGAFRHFPPLYLPFSWTLPSSFFFQITFFKTFLSLSQPLPVSWFHRTHEII